MKDIRKVKSRLTRGQAVCLTGILLLTLFLSLYYTLPRLTSAVFGHDEGYYMAMARRLAEEHVFSYGDSGEPNAFVPPGLPLYLLLCFRLFGFGESGLAVMRFLQVGYTVLTVFLVYRLGSLAADGNRRVGLIAALLIASNLGFYSYTFAFLTENLYFLCMMAFALLFCYTQEKDTLALHFLSGLLFCACVMIRSAIVCILLVLWIPVFQRHRQKSEKWLGRIAAFAAGFVLLALPWWIRNWVTLHELILFCKQPHIVFAGLAENMEGYAIPASLGGYGEILRDLLRKDAAGTLRYLTIGKFSILFWEHPDNLNARLTAYSTAFLACVGLPICIGGLFSKKRRAGSAAFLLYLLVVLCGVPDQRYGLQFLFYLAVCTALFLDWGVNKLSGRQEAGEKRREESDDLGGVRL